MEPESFSGERHSRTRGRLMAKRRKRTPWDRLLRAAQAGRGIRFTPEELRKLRFDRAIETRAELDAECFDKGHDPYSCRDPECEL